MSEDLNSPEKRGDALKTATGRRWRGWPSTADQWIEFTKDAYAAGLITEAVFTRTIDRLVRRPEDLRLLTLDLPLPRDLNEALLA